MDFFLNPQNACRVSPPDVNLEFVDPPEKLTTGCEVEFRVTSFGTRHTAKHRIQVADLSFVEEQTQGPMRKWKHTHRFEATHDGKTRIADHIEFTPPGGLAGLVATEARIRAKLEKAFEYQHEQLKRLLPLAD